MKRVILLVVGIIFTLNIFAGEPVKIKEFRKTDWTKVYNESDVQIFYMRNKITKKNNEKAEYIIFKVINNNPKDIKVSLSTSVSYGLTGDIIAKSSTKVIEIPANSFVVDLSKQGESKLRVPLKYKSNRYGAPLTEININNVIIE